MSAQSSNDRPFDVFNKLFKYPDLVLYLTTQHVEPRELTLLYRISRPFHYLVNSHLTNYVLSSARRWGRLTHSRPSFVRKEPGKGKSLLTTEALIEKPSRINNALYPPRGPVVIDASGTEPTPPGIYSRNDISTLMPFKNYSNLCKLDPSMKVRARPMNKNAPIDASTLQIRHVPSFRYLAFLLWRARLIQVIITGLLVAGHRLPTPRASSVLAKIWFIMDIPTNAKRLALMRNKDYWSSADLWTAQLFFIKLDMAFTDPVNGHGEATVRKVLMAQRSLSTTAHVLERSKGRTVLELTQMFILAFHKLSPDHRAAGYSVLGVPASQAGMLGVEGWGQRVEEGNALGIPVDPYERNSLLRPDQLVIYECFNRGLTLDLKEMMAFGYVDYALGVNLPRIESQRIALLNSLRKDQEEAEAMLARAGMS